MIITLVTPLSQTSYIMTADIIRPIVRGSLLGFQKHGRRSILSQSECVCQKGERIRSKISGSNVWLTSEPNWFSDGKEYSWTWKGKAGSDALHGSKAGPKLSPLDWIL